MSYLFGAQANAVTFCSPSMGLSTDLRCRSCMSSQYATIPSDCCLWTRMLLVKHSTSHNLLQADPQKTLTSNPCLAKLAQTETNMQALRQGRRHLLQACQLQQARFLNVHEYQVWPQEEIQL